MSDPYTKAKAGRLTFKGGELAAVKSIVKKKKKQKQKQQQEDAVDDGASAPAVGGEGASGAEGQPVYTIDAAKRMKYEELFPVESKKFGYDPANKSRFTARTSEEALEDRVKKKADRYCK